MKLVWGIVTVFDTVIALGTGLRYMREGVICASSSRRCSSRSWKVRGAGCMKICIKGQVGVTIYLNALPPWPRVLMQESNG